MNAISKLCQTGLNLLSNVAWFPPLFARICIGYAFYETGKGKLLNIERPIALFTSLGIPFPQANAIFVSWLECVGGVLVMLGLCTRLVSIPLAATMAVAIGTAKWAEVTSFSDFAWLLETAYLLIFLWLATAGPGAVSVDHLISKKLKQ